MSITPSVAVNTVKKPTIPISKGNILYVGGTGPNNYTKIQDAIDDAYSGDTVFVFDDSSPYYENLRILKRINLTGENKNTTVINSVEQSETVVDIFPSADNVIVSGFTITGGDEGIYIDGNNNVIRGNKIFFNEFGIKTSRDANNNLITNNIIVHNTIVGVWEGCKDSYNTVTWNVISGNGDPDYKEGGIFKHHSGGIFHHNDFDLNRGCNIYTDVSSWGVWDDDSEGNYWYDWELNPGYPDVYVIPAWLEDQYDYYPKATSYFSYPIIYIHESSHEAYPGEPVHFWSHVNKPISSLSFFWNFGDGNTSNKTDPDHTYSKSGIYHINVTVTDDKGVSDTDRSIAYIGFPPDKPTIKGPTIGNLGERYEYSINATDSDSDYLHYYIEWGDLRDDYIGPYPTGETVKIGHDWWDYEGNYTIRVKAIDDTLLESYWAYLTVQIPRNRAAICSLFQFLFERFPLLEVFLRAMNQLR